MIFKLAHTTVLDLRSLAVLAGPGFVDGHVHCLFTNIFTLGNAALMHFKPS